MLRQVVEGVFVHESEFCQTNTVVVDGRAGVLLVDPGIHGLELECLVRDLADSGRTVAAGFSTHPHWDHLLWHPGLGSAPRWATALAAATAEERLSGGIDAARAGIPEDVPLGLLGEVAGLAAGATEVPWDGDRARIIEHSAHAVGHAALLIERRGVLIAGDMLFDVLIPMLDASASEPFDDYLVALEVFEGVAAEVEYAIPGHGSVAVGEQIQERIGRDRAYVLALRDDGEVLDPRIGPSAAAGWEWVTDIHAGQLARLGR